MRKWGIMLTKGQGEGEARARRSAVFGPEAAAVRFDDRAADREPHTHSRRLGGEEGFEGPIGFGQSWPRIADVNAHRIVCKDGLQTQLSLIWRHIGHRFDCISNDVHEDLLDLNRVDRDRRQILSEPDIERYSAARELFGEKFANLFDEWAER